MVARLLAIDPGVSGAYAVYDADEERLLECADLPSTTVRINRKERQRLDTQGLAELFAFQAMVGIDMAFIEAVGGRPGQAASTAYVLGHGVGLMEMGLIANNIPYVLVPPNRWKGALRITGKSASVLHGDGSQRSAIFQRACDLMPEGRSMFTGTRGGKKIDRAEAAMIAWFSASFIWPTVKAKEGTA